MDTERHAADPALIVETREEISAQRRASEPAAPQLPGAETAARPQEPLLTLHRLVEACPEHAEGLEYLHADLFDSRLPVALSALDAVRIMADVRSFPYVAKHLSSPHEEVQCAAVRALGSIRCPEASRVLLQLQKTTPSEKLRREALTALVQASPQDKEVVGIVRQAARSPLGPGASRAHAAGLFLGLGGPLALEELLVDARDEVIVQVLSSAAEDARLAPRTVTHYAAGSARLPAGSRAALVALAARHQLPESCGLLCRAFADPHGEVRRAAYAALGEGAHQAAWTSAIVEAMSAAVESNPSLEDEAHLAIARLERTARGRPPVAPHVRDAHMARITELYAQLSTENRRVASDAHELGWLITRSKEYVEYYFDDELKAALLRWLKGSSSETENGLLKQLKGTAARVEVRHFDGYSAVSDLIKNPRRNGIALVARELALARTGKSRQFWLLIRAIRMAAVFLTPASPAAEGQLLKGIYQWARQAKLYRLADASLCALAKVDVPAAVAACGDCMAIPLASKVLAITSLHLMREISPEAVEPAAIRLLASQDDPYVTLNALEVLSAGPSSANAELARTLLSRLALAPSREVRDAIVQFLGGKISIDITESLKEPCLSGDEVLRTAALSVLERRIAAGLVGNRDGTIEFLYRLLRGNHEPSRRSAAIMLWKMGDDYAHAVLRDLLAAGSDGDIAQVLLKLQGDMREPLVTALAPLFGRDGAVVQEALRTVLVAAPDRSMTARGLALALQARGLETEEEGGEAVGGDSPAVEVHSEKTVFRFERENMQELVMLFSDIVGYSKKAQLLAPMQLSALIQEYEGILLTHVEAHEGELIKRMGDGHMIVFRDPVAAVLAAIRLQKALRRFNRYRDESTRVAIRIGIHSGKVLRKAQGDVLGSPVNIAARLESSARPGSILVSEIVHACIKDAVHAREIGHITVKNISEPIRVFEPYEIVLDLPAELDPLKRTRPTATAAPQAPADTVPLDRATYAEIIRCFSALLTVCKSAEGGQVSVDTLNSQVLARLRLLRPRLPNLPAARGTEGAPAEKRDATGVTA